MDDILEQLKKIANDPSLAVPSYNVEPEKVKAINDSLFEDPDKSDADDAKTATSKDSKI